MIMSCIPYLHFYNVEILIYMHLIYPYAVQVSYCNFVRVNKIFVFISSHDSPIFILENYQLSFTFHIKYTLAFYSNVYLQHTVNVTKGADWEQLIEYATETCKKNL